MGNTLALEHRGRGLKPEYRQIHNGLDDSPLSLGSIPSDRLKKLKDVDKRSPLSLCLSVTRKLGLYLCSWIG